jgi:hypothetical protein
LLRYEPPLANTKVPFVKENLTRDPLNKEGNRVVVRVREVFVPGTPKCVRTLEEIKPLSVENPYLEN